MDQLEKNIINSFGLVKSDIIKLQQDVIVLTQNQQRLVKLSKKLKEKVSNAPKKEVKIIEKVVGTRKKTNYIASKTGTKFHVESCPFGQNILPKMKVKYSSKTKALNNGLKPCKCVK